MAIVPFECTNRARDTANVERTLRAPLETHFRKPPTATATMDGVELLASNRVLLDWVGPFAPVAVAAWPEAENHAANVW
jgi:hypothetical protein